MNPDTYNFQLTGPEADLIGAALGKLPMETVLPLFTKLMGQVNAQNAERAASVAEKQAVLQAEYGGENPPASAGETNVPPAPKPVKKVAKKSATAELTPAAPAPVTPPAAETLPIPSAPLGLPPLPAIPQFGV